MSDPVVVMQRYELKYILNKEQIEYLKKQLVGKMEIDQYGLTSIASLYYDTPDYRLIRTSQEKPLFKEKIRLRSYGIATNYSPVFLELKRKAYGIVYKRRVQSTIPNVQKFFSKQGNICADGQIAREITYFRDYYNNLTPSCLIIYDRTAYYEPNGDLRLTLDYNPRYRIEDLNLTTSMEGISLLNNDSAILEIKVQGAMPLWLTHILDDAKIYKGTFSKYGEAYKQQAMKAQVERKNESWKAYFNQYIQLQ